MRQNDSDRLGSALQQQATACPPPDNSRTIALLEQWTREDATDDATAIAQADRELSEFKANLNANRPPDRPVFP